MNKTRLDEHRNLQAEALLDEVGLDYELVWMTIDDIDMKASLQNQARIIPLDPDRKDRYRAAISAGAKFPAPLIGNNGKAKGIVGDGNTRICAWIDAGYEQVPAYLFHYKTEAEFRAIADLANARLNGEPNTLQERLAHAARACERTGMTNADAAVLFGVTKSGLTAYRRAILIRSTLVDLGVPIVLWRDLSDAMIVDLGGLVTDDAWVKVLSTIKAGITHAKVVAAIRHTNSIKITKARTKAQWDIMESLLQEQHTARALAVEKKPMKHAEPERINIMQLKGAAKVIAKTIRNPTPAEKEVLDHIYTLFDGQ